MRLAAATFAPGLFASPVLFGLFCWPFLAVWVLRASRRPAQAGRLSLFGLGISLVALLGCSSGLGWGQELCLGLAASVPALLAGLRNPVAGEAGREDASAWLPLLVTGCTLMALLLRSPLGSLSFDAAGVVMLALWDGRATRRAMPAWEMVRLRLSGVILAGLGLMVMQGGPVFSTAETAGQIGQVLALAGLCMMAGLGSAVSSRAELALLDVGLRFVPLFLMPSLLVSPFSHKLMVLAGLLALAGMFWGRPGRLPLLPWLAGLGLLAAGTGQMLALLLLYATALLATALRLGCASSALDSGEAGLAALPVQLSLPVILVVLAMVTPPLGWAARGVLLACLMLGLWQVRLGGLADGLLRLWQRGGPVMRMLLLLLVGLTLLAVILLASGPMPVSVPLAG